MPGTGPTGVGVLANTPTIENLSVATANAEVQYPIPANTRKLIMRARTVQGQPTPSIQFAFTANESNSTFITVPPGGVYSEDNLDLTDAVLYLRTNLASQIIEILSWQRI
jgi:hypothetical protein